MLEGVDVKAVAGGANRFAVDLHSRLRRRDQNLIFSPFSVFAAAAMAFAGARGDTARGMAGALRLPPDPAQAAAVGALLRDLLGGGASRAWELNIANALWGRAGYPFLPEFLRFLEQHFGAGLRQADFDRSVEACGEINGWVSEQTRGKITQLLSPDSINELTQLILVNAIYFKGRWNYPFDKDDTRDGTFVTAAGEKLAVPKMSQSERLRYLEAETFQAVELPYLGGRLSMAVFLPAAKTGLDAFEEQLAAEQLAAWLAQMRSEEVRLRLPKFEMRCNCPLTSALKAMGLGCMFGAGADYSGMDGGRTLAISEAIHQACVEVNEEGTVAAAATALIVETLSIDDVPRYKLFDVDRPFLFLIRDRQSGAVLFMGRVVNPVAK